MKRLIIIIIFIIGCYNENIFTPETEIILSPKNGSVFNNNSVKIVWRGENSVYYQYSIDGKISGWTKEESVFLILDDGWHNFWVRGKNILEEKEMDYSSISFLVDGIRNGFSISPIFDSFNISDEIKISLKGERLKPHNFEYIKLLWEKELTLIDYRIDSTTYSEGSIPIIIVREYPCSLEIFRTNLNGYPEDDILIGNFRFSAMNKGVYNFYIKDAKIFDSIGNEIEFDTISGGKVVIY
uniref:Uncharacterized protein n=1 Tax=candidate division WOR-3 bacterium TaxID=2052148 RepID=A0A7C4U6X3_UNCW3